MIEGLKIGLGSTKKILCPSVLNRLGIYPAKARVVIKKNNDCLRYFMYPGLS